jgi:Heparinase II/III-like protein/Heparinase II/III N-terminus
MNRLTQAWQALRCLGPSWLLFRALYAIRQRTGYDARRWPVSRWDEWPLGRLLRDNRLAGPETYADYRQKLPRRFFFNPGPAQGFAGLARRFDQGGSGPLPDAERIIRGEYRFFDHSWRSCGSPPDWHQNPWTSQTVPSVLHWSRISEFGFGDIKLVWELNRFGFVFPLVRAFWRTGDESLAECFWQLIENWRARNPPQAGVNWKCGQEASLRVMAWCFGLYGLAGATASSAERIARLAQMLAVTGQRIATNLRYALSQQNNHGISEAAGLWTLGTLFPEFREAARWRELGRAALESQARDLIYDDGGFSQHSVNYHRVMVEDYLWCIQIGRVNGDEFTPEVVRRVGQAGHWLASFLDPETGRVPNWGSNDGGRVLPLSNCGYLDYRPVVQAVAMITAGKPTLPAGPWDEQAWWLGCPVAAKAPDEATIAGGRQDFPDSGLTLLRQGTARVVLRTLRRFRHRPAQCDLLHLDLWSGASNVLRDTGSYSYNPPNGSGSHFKSVAAHNTIQFDGHEQMPVLGRFLYGQWPQGEVSLPADDPTQVTAAYVDWQGCRHERRVELAADRCLVSDRLSGFHQEAVLRWHLSSQVDWELNGSTCSSRLAVIRVSTGEKYKLSRLAEGWESLFYNTKTPIPVFEVTVVAGCAEIETEILLA